MKLYEMMDKTPLDITDGKTYLDYMRLHRPNYLQEIVKRLVAVNINRPEYLAALNLGANMALLQVLHHGIPDDLEEVYGSSSGIFLPPGYKR